MDSLNIVPQAARRFDTPGGASLESRGRRDGLHHDDHRVRLAMTPAVRVFMGPIRRRCTRTGTRS